MNKGIEYIVEQDAIDLCAQLDPLKDPGDVAYSAPIKKYDGNKWFVQILNKDLVHITAEEFSNLVDFPGGYFDPNEL